MWVVCVGDKGLVNIAMCVNMFMRVQVCVCARARMHLCVCVCVCERESTLESVKKVSVFVVVSSLFLF